ncbi:MAG: hypothetical protein KGL39_27275 [Patescibacteria group bacterium]|nr:hypothetical protein [Patescibacteria group bacterium]
MRLQPKLVWLSTEAERSPQEHLDASSDQRLPSITRYEQWQKYDVKKWYEGVIQGKCDLNAMPADTAAEVAHLRTLLNGACPWLGIAGKATTEEMDKDLPEEPNPLRTTALSTPGKGRLLRIQAIHKTPQGVTVYEDLVMPVEDFEEMMRRSDDPWYWRGGSGY